MHQDRTKPDQARATFDGKPVAVDGIVAGVESYVGALSGTSWIVRLGDEGGAQATCLFDEEDADAAERLVPGRLAVLVGISAGLETTGASVYLEHCLVR